MIALVILKVSQLFELLSESQLFDQDDAENYSKELHLQFIVECLGQFPLEFLQACEDRKKYFDKEGERRYPANHDGPQLICVYLGKLLQTNSNFQPTTLEAILRTLDTVDENDIPGAAAFMRRCFALDPKVRPSAQELLTDSWLVL